MTRIRRIASHLTLLSLVAAAPPAATLDGFLDPTFWSDGKIFWSQSAGDYWAEAVVAAPDGRLVIAGGERPDGSEERGFWRRVGDSSYSAACRLEPFSIFTASRLADATFDSQGRLVVGGTLLGPNGVHLLVVARYLYPGCTLDTSFDTDGIRTLSVPGGPEKMMSVAIDLEGRIVVLATQNDFNQPDTDLIVGRITAAGALDATFSGDGWTTIDITGLQLYDGAEDLVIDGAGRLIVAGWTGIGLNTDWMILALQPDGTPDLGFGVAGVRRVGFDLGGVDHDVDEPTAIALDPIGGRLVVAGWAETATVVHGVPVVRPAVARLLADGSLDPSFSSDGKLTEDLGGSSGLIDVAVDGLSRIVGAGFLDDAESNRDFLALRYTPAGTLDPAFHVFGYTHVPFDAGTGVRVNDVAGAVAFQAGRVVLAGSATVDGADGRGEHRVAMARLQTDLVFADGFESAGERFWSVANGVD